MAELAHLDCVPCRGGAPTLTETEVRELLPQVPEWTLEQQNGIWRLQRVFQCKNFVEAMAFTNKVASLAEQQGHHPLIITEWGRVTIQWWTHVIKGLHNNDFVMAAKTDELFQK
jgi:4a-hydroxytetrahydrobiopterin dehydratase